MGYELGHNLLITGYTGTVTQTLSGNSDFFPFPDKIDCGVAKSIEDGEIGI